MRVFFSSIFIQSEPQTHYFLSAGSFMNILLGGRGFVFVHLSRISTCGHLPYSPRDFVPEMQLRPPKCPDLKQVTKNVHIVLVSASVSVSAVSID